MVDYEVKIEHLWQDFSPVLPSIFLCAHYSLSKNWVVCLENAQDLLVVHYFVGARQIFDEFRVSKTDSDPIEGITDSCIVPDGIVFVVEEGVSSFLGHLQHLFHLGWAQWRIGIYLNLIPLGFQCFLKSIYQFFGFEDPDIDKVGDEEDEEKKKYL